MNKINKDFTFLELGVVSVIIRLLGGTIGPNLFKNLENSEKLRLSPKLMH